MGLSKKNAQELWDKVMDFVCAEADLAGEGNSGEFHDEEESDRLWHETDFRLRVLRETFKEKTGWLPEPIDHTEVEHLPIRSYWRMAR